jgi:hypothetical protein
MNTAERSVLAVPGLAARWAIEPGGRAQQQQAQQLEERLAELNRLGALVPEKVRNDLRSKLELSWIHHDSALEGVVYQIPELMAALRGEAPPEAALVPTFDEIRQNKAAIDLIRDLAGKGKVKIDLDLLRDLYACLAPDEMEGKKQPVYRKDMPVHRLYFHEIVTPDKIIPRLKTLVQWANAADTRRSTHVSRLAAKIHFQLLQIYPFPKHSGRIARLAMNLVLLNAGYPPAVIHSTERQRYYDALKTNDHMLASVVREALLSSLESGIRFYQQALPPPPPPPAPKKLPRTHRPSAAQTLPKMSGDLTQMRPSSAPMRTNPIALLGVRGANMAPRTAPIPPPPPAPPKAATLPSRLSGSKPAEVPRPAKPSPVSKPAAKPPAAKKVAPKKPVAKKPKPAPKKTAKKRR